METSRNSLQVDWFDIDYLPPIWLAALFVSGANVENILAFVCYIQIVRVEVMKRLQSSKHLKYFPKYVLKYMSEYMVNQIWEVYSFFVLFIVQILFCLTG